jgi:IS5 family transposase
VLPGQRGRAGEKGGAHTGPNPTDRSKAGCKRHVLVDGRGVPLALALTAANVHDGVVFEDLIDAVPPVRQAGPGRPRRRPEKRHGDKAYDVPRCRRALRRRGIKDRLARRGVERSDRLGRHRWVVERTLAWFSQFRRLVVRYERRADIHRGLLTLAAILISFRFVQRWFC